MADFFTFGFVNVPSLSDLLFKPVILLSCDRIGVLYYLLKIELTYENTLSGCVYIRFERMGDAAISNFHKAKPINS
jgi:hypothetical protein